MLATDIRTYIVAMFSNSEAGKVAIPLQAKLSRARLGITIEMERLLNTSIENNTQRRIPISSIIIQEKATSLYEDLKKFTPEKFGDTEPFDASNGWFDRFRQRSNLHNVSYQGEAAVSIRKKLITLKNWLKLLTRSSGKN
jgi:hypothetical protein